MDEQIEDLVIEVRADTRAFRTDIEAMRANLDAGLVEGFVRAGNVLERGLLSAIRRGSLGFDELKAIALGTMGEIAAHAVQTGLGSLFRVSAGTGLGSLFGSFVNGLFGLPGRATGGPVSPGRAYLVGESGPEVFVPASSGRVETAGSPARARDVRIAIQLAAPRGADMPVALRRSARQVASAVRRALEER